MKFWLLYLFLNSGNMKRVFSFDSSSDQSISYATVKSPVRLPETFTMCSSFKESSISGSSFFTIYGEDGGPWLTLSNWVTGNKITSWLRIRTVWIKVGIMKPYLINFWIYVCIHVNTKSGDLSLSFNGEPPLSFKIPELKDQTPKDL